MDLDVNNDAFINHMMTIPSLDSIPAARMSNLPESEAIVPASAAVSGSGVLGFVEGMSEQGREDVLDSYTYATLAADRRHSAVEEPGEWYSTFREVMTKVMHWTPQDTAYTSYSSHERVLTMDQVALKLLAASLAAAGVGGGAGPQLLDIAEEALEKLAENEEPLSLFEYRTTQPQGGSRFMVGGCRESQDGVIVLALGAVELKTELTVGNILFFNWNSISVELHRSSDVFVFHQSLYALRREKIRQALLNAADAAIAQYPI